MPRQNFLISEIAEQAGIPENTARRYTKLFKTFFSTQRFGRQTKYYEEAAVTLSTISSLYKKGLSTQEVRIRLLESIDLDAKEHPEFDDSTTDFPRQEKGTGLQSYGSGQLLEAGSDIFKLREQLPSDFLEMLDNEVVSATDQDVWGQAVTYLWKQITALYPYVVQVEQLGVEVDNLRNENNKLQEVNEVLRDELAELRTIVDSQEPIGPTHEDFSDLRNEHASFRNRIRTELDGITSSLGPSEEFICLPLVFRSENGEYLGVSDKSKKHFSLKDFIRLIEKNAANARSIAMVWNRQSRGVWRLTIKEQVGIPGKEKVHYLNVSLRRTPKGNTVVLLEQVFFNGKQMPAFFLYELFKQIGKEFS